MPRAAFQTPSCTPLLSSSFTRGKKRRPSGARMPSNAIRRSASPWAHEAGGFPIMTLPLGFLMKDVLFLVASFYLLKQATVKRCPHDPLNDWQRGRTSNLLFHVIVDDFN